MWDIATAIADSEKAHRLAEGGWEPFAVTWQDQPASRATIYFRLHHAAQPISDTAGSGMHHKSTCI